MPGPLTESPSTTSGNPPEATLTLVDPAVVAIEATDVRNVIEIAALVVVAAFESVSVFPLIAVTVVPAGISELVAVIPTETSGKPPAGTVAVGEPEETDAVAAVANPNDTVPLAVAASDKVRVLVPAPATTVGTTLLNSVIAPVGVIRPIALIEPGSVNQTLPSGPAATPLGALPPLRPLLNSEIACVVVLIVPIADAVPLSPNHMFPSGPADDRPGHAPRVQAAGELRDHVSGRIDGADRLGGSLVREPQVAVGSRGEF